MACKRFVVFGFHDQYPAGGWGDYCNSFDTKEEAEAYVNSQGAHFDNYEVIDLEDPSNFKESR